VVSPNWPVVRVGGSASVVAVQDFPHNFPAFTYVCDPRKCTSLTHLIIFPVLSWAFSGTCDPHEARFTCGTGEGRRRGGRGVCAVVVLRGFNGKVDYKARSRLYSLPRRVGEDFSPCVGQCAFGMESNRVGLSAPTAVVLG
jgi:hypothetical protein